MEALIFIVIAAGLGAVWYFNREKGFDANKDGKVNLDDVKPVVENTVKAVEAAAVKAADVNKDGKVDVADVKVVAKKTATKARATATKAKTAVKKARTPRLKVAK